MSQHAAPTRQGPGKSQIFGELLLTFGVIILLFTFYEAYWTNLSSGRLQDAAQDQLDEDWGVDEDQWVNPRQQITPELGEAFARIYIPSFGSDFQFAIVEGTEDADLLAGPGRYVDSQMPGEPGNFAVAGHRVGKGAPFNDLDNLEVCDAVVIETQTDWVTYRILPIDATGDVRRAEASECLSPEQVERVSTGDYSAVNGRHITLPGAIEVINPIPGSTEVNSTEGLEGLITLTTCHPRFSNAQRMIIHAMEVESTPKTDGQRPAVLEEN
ncbi:class E sortase [Corynebacterium alimapuense]|uniref:Class E sortase n=1 Tax=Corynebacterium alimapuense TaxID=1576874 RepID=A0A3M8KBY0_9CORY|nr:class E sortase [Corynebacterium alimapuense]RNE50042.1 class E sortase [Corynebacterium alimapuense]